MWRLEGGQVTGAKTYAHGNMTREVVDTSAAWMDGTTVVSGWATKMYAHSTWLVRGQVTEIVVY